MCVKFMARIKRLRQYKSPSSIGKANAKEANSGSFPCPYNNLNLRNSLNIEQPSPSQPNSPSQLLQRTSKAPAVGNSHDCSVCGKKFAHKGDFMKHFRIHTGEQPFECNVCGKKFAQKVNLVNHLITHTGAKPYKCTVCSKQFRHPSSFSMHNRKHII